MQIFRFFTAQVKVHKSSHVIFQTKSEFFFKLWITVQCYERYLFCTFLAETKGALSVKLQTFDCSRKISPNSYFDSLLKVYKILAEQFRRVISHGPEY